MRDGAKGVDPPVLHQLVRDEDVGVFRERQRCAELLQESLIAALRIQLVPGALRNNDQRIAGDAGQDLHLFADQVSSLNVGL